MRKMRWSSKCKDQDWISSGGGILWQCVNPKNKMFKTTTFDSFYHQFLVNLEMVYDRFTTWVSIGWSWLIHRISELDPWQVLFDGQTEAGPWNLKSGRWFSYSGYGWWEQELIFVDIISQKHDCGWIWQLLTFLLASALRFLWLNVAFSVLS